MYAEEDKPRVLLSTTMGDIELELNRKKAPVTVENFLTYVRDGHYDNLIFHRVVYGWIIQSGEYTKDFKAYETRSPIKNEATNGLKNVRGTIAMARLSDPHSADSQFFINLDNNTSFNHRSKRRREYGYCVFGKVIKGMDVADAISEVEKHEEHPYGVSVPLEPIIILSAKVIGEENPPEQEKN